MEIHRFVQTQVEKLIGRQKVVLLYGARRTGKTTIIENLAQKYPSEVLLMQGEDMDVADLLQQRTIANYTQICRGKKIIIIDEAQAVPEIGNILKLMIDNIKGITIIATGSSSLDLVNKTGEPLVGRNIVFNLFPVAQTELYATENKISTLGNLEQRLIYGSYPELWHLESNAEKQQYLKEMVNSYLLKDLLALENIKGASTLYKLLQLLAWQIGSQVSTVELGNTLQINKATVEKYMDLLSKVFVIYPLTGYSNNLRKEVSKSKKWYFYDNGVRNALINNFSPLMNRNDTGQLWEQYVMSERIKYNSSRGLKPEYYFWRTYDGQEIDLVEVDNQELHAFECKWQQHKTIKTPEAFAKAYPSAQFTVIDKTNYLDWICG